MFLGLDWRVVHGGALLELVEIGYMRNLFEIFGTLTIWNHTIPRVEVV